MKRALEFVLVFICLMPIIIFAKPVNYNQSVTKAKNYIKNFKDYNDYIIYENMKYDSFLVDNKLVLDTNALFQDGTGAFISRDEFIITNVFLNSYLASGLEYWTLTPYSFNRNYAIGYKLFGKDINENSGAKVTEFIKNEAKIGGSGTKENPWYFLDVFRINLYSSNAERGLLSLSECSNISQQDSSITLFKYGENLSSFYACPKDGFRYHKSSCDNYFNIESGSNKIGIKDNIKDNTICRIDFGYKTHEITLEQCSDCSKATPAKFYLAVNHDNYFKDEFGIEGLSKISKIPAKTGYTFKGYYTDEDGYGTKVINEDKTFKTKNLNSSVKLYPWMKANTYTISFSDEDGGNQVEDISVVFDSAYGELPSIGRRGYTFKGWYTASSGGSQVESTTIVKTANNHTLYARWEAKKFTVTFDSTGGSAPDPSSKQVIFDDTYGTLPSPNKDKYLFDGWFTSESGGVKIDEDTVVNIVRDQTLYAQWRIASSLPSFTYTGKFSVLKDDGTNSEIAGGTNTSFTGTDYEFLGNWKVKLLSDGNLTVYSLGFAQNIDIFLVGGGASGERGSIETGCYSPNRTCYNGGSGGNGGACSTNKNISLSLGIAYSVDIGGTNASSTFAIGGITYSAAGGAGAAGGPGWGGSSNDGGKGTDGCYEFGVTGATRYGGGGGGAAGSYSSDGRTGNGGAGGAGGGGAGGKSSTYGTATAGKDGATNYGGGGGGGGAKQGTKYSGGVGGSGVVIFRNSR